MPLNPAALKAFAHPLRMSLYSELTRRGSATASQLGRALGESSGQTSYHLRQLAAHGFVEDDPSHSGGRERWWRPVGFRLDEPDYFRNSGTAQAAAAVVQQSIAERAAALSAWAAELDPDQRFPGLLSSSTAWITEEEAQRLSELLTDMLGDYLAPLRGRVPPEDAHRVRIHIDVFRLMGAAGQADGPDSA